MSYPIHVCVPRVLALARRIVRCRPCGRRTRHVVEMFEWYESLWKCCACGALDGYRGDRWTVRERAVRAKRDWKRALPWRKATAKAARQIMRRRKP